MFVTQKKTSQNTSSHKKKVMDVLFDAIKCGDLKTVKSFDNISNIWNDRFAPPMHYAIAFGQMEILDYFLINNPEMVTPRNYFGKTALHLAVSTGDICMVEKLVLVATDLIHIRDTFDFTPLQRAVWKSECWQIASFMIAQKPDSVNQITDCDGTLLHIAAGRHDTEMVRGLLTVCPLTFLTTTNKYHCTPLLLAIKDKDSFDIVKLLIDADPRAIDITDYAGSLPIFKVKNVNILTYLLTICPHAIHHKKPITCENLLHVACDCRQTEITNMLLQHCPSLLHEKTMNGESPLQVAYRNTYIEHVNAILRFKPDLVDTDNEGNTVLHMAVKKRCNYDVVLAVFQNCPSNLSYVNTNGKTPMCLAVDTYNTDVVEMFQPHMTTDMAVALNDVSDACCQISLKDYAAKQCAVVLNNHLLPDMTQIVLEFLGITKTRKY